jgi:RNA polymerase sigma-54 factor
MALDLRLQQKMSQQLVMTPQLQQAIKLLQLSHMELADVLQKELEENPVLEEREGQEEGVDAPDAPDETAGEAQSGTTDTERSTGEGDGSETRSADGDEPAGDGASPEPTGQDLLSAEAQPTAEPATTTPEPTTTEVDREMDWEAYLESYSYSLPATAGAGGGEELPPFEASLTKPTSLIEHLRWQIHMGDFSQEETNIALLLCEEINEDGYLAADAVQTVADELEISQDEVLAVLKELQAFDPAGVAARDLRECLLIQAGHLTSENPLVLSIVDKHLKNVEKKNFAAIAKDLGTAVQDVAEAVKIIAHLEPRPGRTYTDREPQYITPDIYVYKVGAEYVIMLNEDGLPKLRVSNYYKSALSGSGGTTKSYIQEKLRSAAWLIRSIHMRQRTIYRVMESILKFQREFFDKGVAHLKPLILKDVAEDVGMHESTISRVTTNKYVHTPQGIYELKYFFNSSINTVGGDSIASESVRDHIKRLIDEEDKHTPFSDQEIVERLKKTDIDIARRTVAKYREMLRIPSSSKRRQVF